MVHPKLLIRSTSVGSGAGMTSFITSSITRDGNLVRTPIIGTDNLKHSREQWKVEFGQEEFYFVP